MATQTKTVVFTYHGLHSRKLTTSIDNRLFRNSIPEDSFRKQLDILCRGAKHSGDGSNGRLFYKELFRDQLEVALTFDDGYANSFRAAEIMTETFGTAPLTVFLTTSLIDSSRSIWTVEIALLILGARFRRDRVEFGGDSFNVGTTEERLESFSAIRYRLKGMDAAHRKQGCEAIVKQTLNGELERLLCEYPEFRMLGIEQIRQMQSMGVRFQPHGHTHELFHPNQDPGVIRREIIESKHFIETILNEKCTCFAYPNGDYCEEAMSVLKENGFSRAYTTELGIAYDIENNFKIPRLTPNLKPLKFKRQLRGKTD